MGQAKARGTREQRVAQALARNDAADAQRAAEERQRQIDSLSLRMVLGVRAQRAQAGSQPVEGPKQ